MSTDAAAAKAALRARIRAARAARSDDDRRLASERICHHVLALPELSTVSVAAAYIDCKGEPGTAPLLGELRTRGVRVLLPIQRDDGDLDWGVDDGPARLTTGPHRISEPVGDRLGVEAIGTAQLIVVPALGVDREGRRLGQGGGFYDRALGRADPAALTVALLYDDEVFDELPVDAHDRSVLAAAIPSGVSRFGTRA